MKNSMGRAPTPTRTAKSTPVPGKIINLTATEP